MRRLLATGLLTVLGASFIAFAFMHLAPVDPARFMIGFRPGVREDQINRVREWYGLDLPIARQYVRWLGRAVRGEFGVSMTTRREVGPEVWRRVPWSLLLAALAAVLAWSLALPLAVLAARGGIAGFAAGGLIAAGALVPTFLVATVLVYVFAVRLTLIPILPPFELNLFDPALWLGLLLPSVSLAVPMAGWLALQIRRDLRTVLDAPYIVAARGRGASERRLLWRHAVGVVTRTLVARPLPALSLLFSGLLLVEEIFNWPGIGRSFTRAVTQRDVPVMQGGLFVLSIVIVGLEMLIRLTLGRAGTAPGIRDAGAAGTAAAVRPSPLPGPDRQGRLAVIVILALAAGALAAPLVARFPPDQVLLEEINMSPSPRHWMGTDASGRDQFSRLLHAGRATLGMAIGGAAGAVLVGLGLTVIRDRPGWQTVTQGLSRVLLALPPLGIALAVIATAGRSPWLIAALFAALGLAVVVGPLRVLQTSAWRWTFVQAALIAGASPLRIGERHLVPHLTRPLAAAVAGLVPGFVLMEATLGFLGFSVSPTTPSWGTLLWRAREVLHRGDWWLLLFPAAFLAVTAWAFAALAESLERPHPPTYAAAPRLRLGREWGRAAAPSARRPVGRLGPLIPPRVSPGVDPAGAAGDAGGGSSD